MRTTAIKLSKSLTLEQKNQLVELIFDCCDGGASFEVMGPLLEAIYSPRIFNEGVDTSLAQDILKRYMDGQLI